MNSPHHTVVRVSDACIHVPAYLRKIVGPFGAAVIQAKTTPEPTPQTPGRAPLIAYRALGIVAVGAAILQISQVI